MAWESRDESQLVARGFHHSRDTRRSYCFACKDVALLLLAVMSGSGKEKEGVLLGRVASVLSDGPHCGAGGQGQNLWHQRTDSTWPMFTRRMTPRGAAAAHSRASLFSRSSAGR